MWEIDGARSSPSSGGAGPSSSAAADDESHFWALGLVFTAFSSVGSVCGTILMKVAFKDYENTPLEKQRKCCGIPMTIKWWAGFILLCILPTPLDALSLGLASASLIFPFGVASTVVLSQIIAPLCLKAERLGLWDWVGTFMVVLGAGLSAAFGDHESRSFTGEQIMEMWGNGTFLALFVVASVIFVIAMFLFHTPGMKKRVPAIGIFACVVYIPAYLGGVQTIAFKSFSEVSANSVQAKETGVSEWATFPPYLFIFLTAVLATTQLKYMNSGAERFQATKFFPAYNASLMIMVVIYGAVFFDEVSNLHPVAFPVGLLLIVGGIATLARKDPTDTAAVAAIDRNEEASKSAREGGSSAVGEERLLDGEKRRSDEVGATAEAAALTTVVKVAPDTESIESGSSKLDGGDSLIDLTVASPPPRQVKTRVRTGKVGPPLPPHSPED